MANKPLILLGVVTAIALAGAQANAATCSTMSVNELRANMHFSCTDDDGDTMFSHFDFSSSVPGTESVSFPFDDAVRLGTAANIVPLGTGMLLGYTASTVGGGTFTTLLGQYATHNPSGSGMVQHTLTGNGISNTANNAGSSTITFPGGASVVVTTNTSSHAPGATRAVTEVTNTFTHSPPAPPPPSPVPEPMSLSLFGLGLAGLALAKRRRS